MIILQNLMKKNLKYFTFLPSSRGMTRSCCKKLTDRNSIKYLQPFEQENRRSLVRSPARPIFFPRIDDSHCDWIQFFSHRCPLFRQWLCGKAASGLERMLY